MFDINKFLNAREKRVEYQNTLISTYNLPLLVIRANYPGENKLESLSIAICESVYEDVKPLFSFKIRHIFEESTLEGRTYFLLIDMDPREIKKCAIYFEENHILGRTVDLDVYDIDTKALSREDFHMPKRKCLICEDLAHNCVRSMRHSHSEVKDKIANRYIEYQKYLKKREIISQKISDLTLEAMIYEISATHGFGLVTPLTKGSHKDMDFFTFLKSSFTLKKGFYEMSKLLFSYLPLDIAFEFARKVGEKTEKEMFLATKGINTHKGMIFLLGVGVCAVAKVIYEKKDFSEVQNTIVTMTKNILKDFDKIDKNNLTHGEKLFLECGFTGIRGEIKKGLETIFKGSLEIFSKAYEVREDIDFASLHTLIYLMSVTDDSTIVYRHNFEILNEVKLQMSEIFSKGGAYAFTKDYFFDLEKDYINRNISPGGSADLLALTIFFYKVMDLFKDIEGEI